jgi:glucoamylase
LDEVAFPVLLAWRLWKQNALGNFDPYDMVRRACSFLIQEGPVTAQDRWEEASGYSPSTLAVQIAALICAAEFLAERSDHSTAEFVRDYADFLESHVERWTVTTQGTLVPGISRHYIRINPADINHCADEDPNCGTVVLANQPPGAPYEFPAKEIVDAGFLELVRYGIRGADDPTIRNSIRVVDAVLKIETPYGPSWRRYNHDGYGQRDDGGPYKGWGTGRPWPLLTGERGHYEIAAGRDPVPYLRALEKFAQGIGLIPEQIWDGSDMPSRHLRFGRSTDAAVPLVWAHSEYVKLHRSAVDGRVFELVEPVHDRYVRHKGERKAIEVWKFNRQVQMVEAGTILRMQATSPFLVRWTTDDWQHSADTPSRTTAMGIDYADIAAPNRSISLTFTFLWVDEDRWEGKEYNVLVRTAAQRRRTVSL